MPPPIHLHPLPQSPWQVLDRPELSRAKLALTKLREAGGRPLIVGGWVRDLLLRGIPGTGDIDVEVHNLPWERARKIILDLGGNERGKNFAVLGLDKVEFALPRRERKTRPGHKGFAIEIDPAMPFAEASARRDVTINAMGLDLETGRLLDPHGGRIDLAAGILRHTSSRFAEDPLRVLRVMQFAGRFNFAVAPATIALCRKLDLHELPPERLWSEWKKLLLRGKRPSFGLRFLQACDGLRFFPELAATNETEQDPGWHPEGNVWEHTLLCLDAAVASRSGDEATDLAIMLAVLCHDLGKPATTFFDPKKGRIVSPRHEPEGEAPTRRFLGRLTNETRLTETVVALVRRHLAPHELFRAHQKGADIRPAMRRLALKTDLMLLEKVARADHFGRHTPDALAEDYPAGDFFRATTRELALEQEKPQPLVFGRDLLPLGITPGPELGAWLKRLFAAQLAGEFTSAEEGIALFGKWREEAPQ